MHSTLSAEMKIKTSIKAKLNLNPRTSLYMMLDCENHDYGDDNEAENTLENNNDNNNDNKNKKQKTAKQKQKTQQ